MVKKPYLQLDTPVQYVKGVGPKLAEVLKKRSIHVVKDLIYWLPRTYQDNRVAENLASVPVGSSVIVKAQVYKKNIIPLRGRGKNIYEILISDGTAVVPCKFFRLPYRKWFNSLREGERVEVRGVASHYRGRLEFHHPQIFPASSEEVSQPQDLLLPVYTETEILSQNKIRQVMKNLLQALEPVGEELEWLPQWIRKKYHLVDRFTALKGLHEPDLNLIDSYLEFKTPFQERVIFDEFFELQFYLALKGRGWQAGKAPQIPIDREALRKMEAGLPFSLTLAQKKVLDRIFKDLSTAHPMHRLIQGDVGCGKTLVALMAALTCGLAGFQTAFMVPTEILAEQHYRNALKFLSPFGLRVEKLTGKMKAGEKRTVQGFLKTGACHICIGTHALIQEEVDFRKLGLVIVDEQHRFGAHQRAVLKSKGKHPHFLVMTATPIPRTLSMALYGDLDVSVIDELPPGRQPIVTRRAFSQNRRAVFEFLKEQILKGRQGYVVYPLVEESEVLDLKNAMDQYEKLKAEYKEFQWGLLTGRMHPEEKKSVMDKFRQGEIQILVSTTVIEVGVDVPNANIMIIEHAERFGLSQLHQLRGRVGRGAFKSYCIVVLGERFSHEAKERAYIMEKTSDGFKIAEKDLELRGPGELLGEKQSGLPGFKTAHLVRDAKILYKAREAALDLVSSDPELKAPENQFLKATFEKLSQSVKPG